MSPRGYAEEAATIAAMGFTAYKMRPALGPGTGPGNRAADAPGGRAGRGPDDRRPFLVADGRQELFARNRRAKSCARWRSFIPPGWKNRLPPAIMRRIADCARMKIVPIATGEHEQDEAGFQDLIETRRGGLHPDGRLLPGRVRHGAADLCGGREKPLALCLPQLGNGARSSRRRAPGNLLAGPTSSSGWSIRAMPSRAARNVSLPARRMKSCASRWPSKAVT